MVGAATSGMAARCVRRSRRQARAPYSLAKWRAGARALVAEGRDPIEERERARREAQAAVAATKAAKR
jgi:hypothetical protein